ncbi:outer membrane lipoprotein-sorting protein [Fodinibius halophilus]|uniref:Outer membrane lipoprotein-sorting protein n=1 Tax=Fodinibius halophilus TaxID=1736908 RepID=A0A6M1T4V3_9BACT|nr:outer membrane lipoprotein-sorting protein [Fodinibius halophilus]NGP86991.1 outer membrane lipoprotein-sorting protein [Fodinibius halophilus]
MLATICATILLLSPTGVSPDSVKISPVQILKKADARRTIKGAKKVDVTIEVYTENSLSNSDNYEVLAKGDDKTLIKSYSNDELQRLILSVQNNMWVYYPNTRKPLRISPLQRMMGQVSNADITRINFSSDYMPELLKTETVNGEECYVLQLKLQEDAKHTYPKIRYWVAKDDFKPIKAEFCLVSGKILKSAYYEEYREGILYKTRIESALRNDQYSLIYYNKIVSKEIPDIYFNKNYIRRLIE